MPPPHCAAQGGCPHSSPFPAATAFIDYNAMYGVQYTSWMGQIQQTYKAVDVEVIGGVRSKKETVMLVDKYLLMPRDDRSVFAVQYSGVARICCEEGQRWKLCHGVLMVDFRAG